MLNFYAVNKFDYRKTMAAIAIALPFTLTGCGDGGKSGSNGADNAAATSSIRSSAQDIAIANESELKLVPVNAVASGMERNDLGPDKAIDNDFGTRWSSVFNDQQWIYL